jgi:regulatory protein
MARAVRAAAGSSATRQARRPAWARPGQGAGEYGTEPGMVPPGEPAGLASLPGPPETSEPSGTSEPPADPEAVARLICLRMLTAAPRTRAQLADALRRRGVPDEAAETVLERFAGVQLIDDAMFARAWVDSRHRGRGLARRALAAELRQRGVASEDIQAAVDRLDPEQELATARALVGRRLPGMRGQPRSTRFRRLTGMLARKGYSEGLAYRVVREALENEPSVDGLADLPGPEPDGEPTDW